MKQFEVPEHGGRLRKSSVSFGIPLHEWLDLSTGINPVTYPIPDIPASMWSRLPEENDELEQAATDYYGCSQLLPVAGSQAAIQAIPRLRNNSRVAIINPGYAEHAHAWQQAGHQVTFVNEDEIESVISTIDVLVLINPNNPTGRLYSSAQLMWWHKRLQKHNAWLIVDEAFIDVTPEHSLTSWLPLSGLIVLRSLGKFFGLAGARVGFVFAETEILSRLKYVLGPWSINHPARYVSQLALRDTDWQMKNRQYLIKQGQRLAALLKENGFTPEGESALFKRVCTPRAKYLYEALAQQGILVRLFDSPASLRFGLPRTEKDWSRLAGALAFSIDAISIDTVSIDTPKSKKVAP